MGNDEIRRLRARLRRLNAELERTGRALIESEERLRLVTDVADEFFWIGTPGRQSFTYMSSAFERLFGRGRELLREDGMCFLELVHPDDLPMVRNALTADRMHGWRLQYRIVRPDGAVRWIEDRAHRIKNPNGGVPRLAGTLRDITGLKEAQADLEAALERFATEKSRVQYANERLAHANAKLQRLTLQDPLTGVANRRFLKRFIVREWRREHRHGHAVSLLMADIDFFKDYNDHYGHPLGDECLKRVAAALSRRLKRPTDILVRYGGEEFAAVLMEQGEAEAVEMAEGLRAVVAELGIPHQRSSVASVVTISIGVASVNARDSSFEELLARADRALYAAKTAGRNRVAVAGNTSGSTGTSVRDGSGHST